LQLVSPIWHQRPYHLIQEVQDLLEQNKIDKSRRI